MLFKLCQQPGQNMQRLTAWDKEQCPVKVQGLPTCPELAMDQEDLIKLNGLLHEGELKQATGKFLHESRWCRD